MSANASLMQGKKKTTNCIPEAQNSKKLLELSQNENVKHFKGLKGESYAQGETERACKALGEKIN